MLSIKNHMIEAALQMMMNSLPKTATLPDPLSLALDTSILCTYFDV